MRKRSYIRLGRGFTTVVLVGFLLGICGSFTYFTHFSDMARDLSTLKKNGFKP